MVQLSLYVNKYPLGENNRKKVLTYDFLGDTMVLPIKERGLGCMESKNSFTRITVDQMKERQEQLKLQKMIEHTMSELELLIEEEAEKLAQELVDSGMEVDSFEIATDQQYEEGKIVVTLYVVQEGKTLQFDLKDN